MHAFPAPLPFRIGEEASQNFRVEVALAFKIAIESAVREAGPGHNLLKRDVFESISIEKPPRALNDVFSYFRAVACGIGHKRSWSLGAEVWREISPAA